ncbi:MAG: helix-turn-helix domain-containing protein [Bacteroidales bacterium]|nr:helix-turn-helix domain-containing protein [Bacteroidales bacterium]MCM1415174.1 helix-turn-helix domain-containing protein [bacterium]MCM1423366.1 helix-turn-helix domain-containing protein [bacterium]
MKQKQDIVGTFMGKHITFEQRQKIKEMLNLGKAISEIADTLNVHPGTIYKELKRFDSRESYNPFYAQSLYEKKSKNKGRSEILSDTNLAKYISSLILKKHLSPEKIVAVLAENTEGFSNVPHSANTIYSAIDKGLIPNVTRESLFPKVSTVFSGGQVCIPKWVLDKLNIKDGDELLLEITKNNEIIYKKVNQHN